MSKLRPMTIKDLQCELAHALNKVNSKEEETKLLNTPISAFFDFPIFGRYEEYFVVKVDKKFKLMLYNPIIVRL